jgi:hypothetical protein
MPAGATGETGPLVFIHKERRKPCTPSFMTNITFYNPEKRLFRHTEAERQRKRPCKNGFGNWDGPSKNAIRGSYGSKAKPKREIISPQLNLRHGGREKKSLKESFIPTRIDRKMNVLIAGTRIFTASANHLGQSGLCTSGKEVGRPMLGYEW